MARIPLLVLLIWLLPGCNLPARSATTVPTTTTPAAWIDGPMDGSTIPLAPYEVIFHIADQGGVALGELSINGQLTANIPAAGTAETLATLRYLWSPASPGVYTLQTRGQNTAGGWSDPVSVKVTVGDQPPTITPTPAIIDLPSITPTPTETMTSTPTITTTPTRTLVPTRTATPLPVGFSSSVSTNQIYNGACGVNQVMIKTNLTNAEAVDHVNLFIHLKNAAGSGSTDWYSYGMMNDTGGENYNITVKAANIVGAGTFTKATLYHQFVAYGRGGEELGRSDTYAVVTLFKCITIIPRPLPTLIPPPH